MTDKQPNALRLADDLQSAVQTYPQMSEDEPGGYCRQEDALMDDASAELRRLHAENAALLAERRNLGAAIERQYSAAEQIADRVMRLEGQCDAMLDALKDAEPFLALGIRKKASAAIAKAEGEKQ